MTRVVVTGLGVLSANAHGVEDFEKALREGRSGIRFQQKLKDLGFGCCVGGIPQGVDEIKGSYFTQEALLSVNSSMIYAGIASIDCWKDAGLPLSVPRDTTIWWDTGAIIGCGVGGMDTTVEKLVPMVSAGKVRRMGSAMVEQIMSSAPSAMVGGLLGLGGQVTTNSSACTTGTEAVVNGFFQIREGRAKRMLVGGTEGSSAYVWSGFDSMRVLASKSNDQPEKASRPMSASAAGFVPSSGAGMLMLESLESAKARGARIYAEVLGGHVNCGGQRGGGTMTAPNPEGVVRCIREAITCAKIRPDDVEVINGHLTATMADPLEVNNWCKALERRPENFPLINSTKSMIGHGLGAAGGIECVGAVLQLSRGFVHGSINCEDIHPDLAPYAASIPHTTIDRQCTILAKSSFGFGDVNGCIIFKRWSE